jgi:hypothetical protein
MWLSKVWECRFSTYKTVSVRQCELITTESHFIIYIASKFASNYFIYTLHCILRNLILKVYK